MPLWGKKKPEVAPVAKNELIQKLLALNNPSNSFEIRRSDETDLFVEKDCGREVARRRTRSDRKAAEERLQSLASLGRSVS